MAAPTWTEASVIAAQVLAKGSTLRGTLNLTAKFGAWLYIKLGRGGTTALGTAVAVRVRNVAIQSGGTKSAGGGHPGALVPLVSDIAAAVGTTCATSDSNAGQPVLNVAAIGAIVAGNLICIQDADAGVTRLEWARVSKVAAGVLTLDDNLQYTHTSAGADTVRNAANVWGPIWVGGGALVECIIDYGAAATGESITVQVLAQTEDSIA